MYLDATEISKYGIKTQEDVNLWVYEFANYLFDATSSAINERTNSNREYIMPLIKIVEPLTDDETKELEEINRVSKRKMSEFKKQSRKYIIKNDEYLNTLSETERKNIITENVQQLYAETVVAYNTSIKDRYAILDEKIENTSTGNCTPSENIVHLNKLFFNTEVLSFKTIAHELYHIIRDQSLDYIEKNAGYSIFDMILGAIKDSMSQINHSHMAQNEDIDYEESVDVVKPYITEFFSQLDYIILHDILQDGPYTQLLTKIPEKYNLSFDAVILARNYFQNLDAQILTIQKLFDNEIYSCQELYSIIDSTEMYTSDTFDKMLTDYKKSKKVMFDNLQILNKHTFYSNLFGLDPTRITEFITNIIYESNENEKSFNEFIDEYLDKDGTILDYLIENGHVLHIENRLVKKTERNREHYDDYCKSQINLNQIRNKQIERVNVTATPKEYVKAKILNQIEDLNLSIFEYVDEFMDVLKNNSELFNLSDSDIGYIIAKIVIDENHKDIKNNWAELFSTHSSVLETMYFDELNSILSNRHNNDVPVQKSTLVEPTQQLLN